MLPGHKVVFVITKTAILLCFIRVHGFKTDNQVPSLNTSYPESVILMKQLRTLSAKLFSEVTLKMIISPGLY